MTIIEFFDRDSAIENIAGSLLYFPERIVFIGSNSKRMKRSVEDYKAVLDGRGISVDFSFRTVSRNNLAAITEAIENVINENGECGIDLSGGDELYLVAVGMLLEKYKNNVRIHRLNISNNSMNDCDSEGKVCRSIPVQLSVDENIRVYGGRVIYDNEKPNSTFVWDFSEDFVSDIREMWNICKKDVRAWNAQTNVIAKFCNDNSDKSELTVSAGIDGAQKKPFVSSEIFKALENSGIINNLRIGEKLSFEFKNSQIKKCLTKAGQILELIITVTAYESNDDGGRVYNSVGSGVYIDWDGVVQKNSRIDVENEIDVILMKGVIPVFISCKNGAVDTDELYKLSVVAERFGGKYVRKVLVATQLDDMGYRAEYIRARAKDMDIRLVENVDSMSEKELCDTVAKLWMR